MYVSSIANQLCNKAITIKGYIVDNGLDIILLCETWLSSEKEKKICGDIVPTGFDIVCVNRGRRKGGGVALIHKKTIALSEFKNITTSVFEGLSLSGITCCDYPNSANLQTNSMKDQQTESNRFSR